MGRFLVNLRCFYDCSVATVSGCKRLGSPAAWIRQKKVSPLDLSLRKNQHTSLLCGQPCHK
jgi:hypothetical protein